MSTIYLVITFNTIDSPNFTLPKNPACEEFEKWRAIHASVGDVGGVGGVGDVLRGYRTSVGNPSGLCLCVYVCFIAIWRNIALYTYIV